MSFFSWFTVRKPTKSAHGARVRRGPADTAPAGATPSPAASRASAEAAAQSAQRKQERLARRELLFTVVREAMQRGGVSSGRYKFKVLSLDGSGSRFLVMVDLAQGEALEEARLARIELAMARAARSRHQFDIRGVYWRTNDGPRMPQAQAVAPAQHEAPPQLRSQPQPQPQLDGSDLQDGPATQFEPLLDSEIQAFRQALARGAGAKTQTSAPRAPAQNYTLLTGFEDTEVEAVSAQGKLSATQYSAPR